MPLKPSLLDGTSWLCRATPLAQTSVLRVFTLAVAPSPLQMQKMPGCYCFVLNALSCSSTSSQEQVVLAMFTAGEVELAQQHAVQVTLTMTLRVCCCRRIPLQCDEDRAALASP